MNKIVFSVWMGLVMMHANASEQSNELLLGAGPYFQAQPYQGAEVEVMPTPVAFYDNGIFYVRWVRAGLYFWGDKGEASSWGFSLTAQPRPFGYESGDASVLAGMNERNRSWEGGLSFAASSDLGYIEFLYLTDLQDNSNGSLISGEVGKKYTSGKWMFWPSVSATWFSDDFNDYYYGVSPNEASVSLNRPAYQASSSVSFAIQTYVIYEISHHWQLFGYLRGDVLGEAVRDSPIVGDDYMVSGTLSLLYKFGL